VQIYDDNIYTYIHRHIYKNIHIYTQIYTYIHDDDDNIYT